MDKCYYRFDHYCPWTKTPIARANLRWFYLFLLFQLAHLVSSVPLIYQGDLVLFYFREFLFKREFFFLFIR
jgi:hypothetical protein